MHIHASVRTVKSWSKLVFFASRKHLSIADSIFTVYDHQPFVTSHSSCARIISWGGLGFSPLIKYALHFSGSIAFRFKAAATFEVLLPCYH
jgi:hypothetical protein